MQFFKNSFIHSTYFKEELSPIKFIIFNLQSALVKIVAMKPERVNQSSKIVGKKACLSQVFIT